MSNKDLRLLLPSPQGEGPGVRAMQSHPTQVGQVIQSSILIVGFGSSLRSDDWVGRRVVEAIARNPPPGVSTLCVHQLTPELACSIASVSLAIFVDAYPADPAASVQTIALEPRSPQPYNSHISEPRSLLFLAEQLYGHCPPAWWILVPGVNFALGDRLSETAQQGVVEAIDVVAKAIETHQREKQNLIRDRSSG
ncbi:hydrogenase maturation protease [Synechococcus sp. PCC 7336]|uniref:hydrogenase maturation protease n=1 Tax=Synechococcus sp. PCC 7336 TaxID=195250 RepID=UPI000687E578|nr:hydrogenase maturation protease [Synechococcus sp. PCC 7336]